MGNASTNGLPPVASAGQRVSEQTDAPEQRVRVSQSERRPVGGANKFSEKIPGFFESISDRFKDWRAETALKKAANGAAGKITGGLVSNNFKLVHQGLKQLHNAEQKFPEKGKQVSARVRAAVSAIPPCRARHLQQFAEFRDDAGIPKSERARWRDELYIAGYYDEW